MYKPFRNKIRNLELEESLAAIWARSNYNQFDKPLPNDIEIIPTEKIIQPRSDKKMYNGLDFELEFLLKEVLISSGKVRRKEWSLKKAKYLKSILKELRNFNNELDKAYSGDKILFAINRIVHNQFFWQEKINFYSLFRYYYIYNEANVKAIIEKELGLTPFEIFILGIELTFNFRDNLKLKLPFTFDPKSEEISEDSLNKFLDIFSTSFEKIKEETKKSFESSENIFYTFNPLRAKPIIKTSNTLIAPIPSLIFWQITRGLYYYIVECEGFANAFGKSFELFIGILLERSISSKNLMFYPEHEYYVGKDRKDSVDWLLKDEKGLIFIECKTKRLTMSSKFSFKLVDIEKDLNKLVKFIVQAYSTFIDYKLNHYKNLKFNPKLSHKIVVLTLEEWFFPTNPLVINELTLRIEANLKKEGLDTSILTEIPYYLMSAHEFETEIQIIDKIGIQKYFEKYDTNKLADYRKKMEFDNVFMEDFEKEFISKVVI